MESRSPILLSRVVGIVSVKLAGICLLLSGCLYEVAWLRSSGLRSSSLGCLVSGCLVSGCLVSGRLV